MILLPDEKQADIYKTQVDGATLVSIVLDNILFNSINPQRHSLIQYSGIKVNKNEMINNCASQNIDELCRYITLEKNSQVIVPSKIYTIANPEKYFIKALNKNIKALYEKSDYLDLNVIKLFQKYFEDNPDSIVEHKVRIY